MQKESKLVAPIKKIFIGVLICVVAGLIYSVVNQLRLLMPFGHGAAVLIFYNLGLAGLITGYVFMFLGLKGFEGVAEQTDKKPIRFLVVSPVFLTVSALMAMAASFAVFAESFTTSAGILYLRCTCVGAHILAILSAVLLVIGYAKLKKSESFNEAMKGGFSIIFTAALLILICECLNFGTYVSKEIFEFAPATAARCCSYFMYSVGYIQGAIGIAGLLIALVGWNKVKRGSVKS
ncbi:MAG: hypothetical protein LBQ31_02470 [Bacteroidales bacterium]|jgi:hypothetical protein|nr:hypothetical protein [Bacteroidales bacterium]